MLASLAVRSLEEVAQLLDCAVGLQGGFCAHYFYVWELTEKAIKRLSNPKNPSSLLKDKAQLRKKVDSTKEGSARAN